MSKYLDNLGGKKFPLVTLPQLYLTGSEGFTIGNMYPYKGFYGSCMETFDDEGNPIMIASSRFDLTENGIDPTLVTKELLLDIDFGDHCHRHLVQRGNVLTVEMEPSITLPSSRISYDEINRLIADLKL